MACDAGDIAVLVEADDPFFVFEFTVADFETPEVIRLIGRKVCGCDSVAGGSGDGEDQFFGIPEFNFLDGMGFSGAMDGLNSFSGEMAGITL